MKHGLVLLVALVVVGCGVPKSVSLRIGVADGQPADLTVRATRGKPAVPDHCQTPCVLDIPIDSDEELTLRLPGYYPAVVVLPDRAAWLFGYYGPKATFVIPMVKRATPPDAAPR